MLFNCNDSWKLMWYKFEAVTHCLMSCASPPPWDSPNQNRCEVKLDDLLQKIAINDNQWLSCQV